MLRATLRLCTWNFRRMDKKTYNFALSYLKESTPNMSTSVSTTSKKDSPLDWFIRLIKGVLIGIGFIVPGLSGGVLAVILGIYEPLIRFLGNRKKTFVRAFDLFYSGWNWRNFRRGCLLGIVDYAFTNFAAPCIWLFMVLSQGLLFIQTSGKKGRKTCMAAVLILIYCGHFCADALDGITRMSVLAPSFATVIQSALIGLAVWYGNESFELLIYLGFTTQWLRESRPLNLV